MAGTKRSPDSKLARLAGIPLFRGCSTRQLTLLGRLGEEVRVAANMGLQREGMPGRSWYVLERGSAAVSRGGRPTALFGPGDFWGEAALLGRQPASVTVVTLTPASVLMFDRRAFLGVLNGLPNISMALLETMARWEPPYGQLRRDGNGLSWERLAPRDRGRAAI
jgi:CRP-like cAMP-binding protein